MSGAYDGAAWETFYATIGGATAALAGLLFVAPSLHLSAIVTNPATRGHAREALGGFLSLLGLAVLVLIPDQGRRLLGVELVAAALVLVIVSVHFQGQTLRRLSAPHRLRRVLHLVPINLGTAMILVAGVSLLLKRGGGLYWLVPTVLSFLFNALGNAWALTVQTGES